jgi:hypothetical protein
MGVTRTYFIDLDRLQRTGKDSVLVVRLMMAVNDISSAHWGAEHFKQKQSKLSQHSQQANRRYFILLQCGHLYEAMPLVKEIETSDQLLRILSRCSQLTQDAYRRLQDYLPGGSQRKQLEKYIAPIRNRVAFHYDPGGKQVEKAMVNCPGRSGLSRRRSTLTVECDDSGFGRFGVADDILDTIVCQHWQILREANVQAEADWIADFGARIASDFINFSRELTTHYNVENASVK